MLPRLVLLLSLASCAGLAVSQARYAPPAKEPGPAEKSTKEIQEHVKKLKDEVKRKRLTFEVAHTHVIAHPLHRITGIKVPANVKERAVAQQKVATQVLKIEQEARQAFEREKRVELPYTELRRRLPVHTTRSFDWTAHGKVTPIRDQGVCGSCWDFSACAAFESSYLIHNNRRVDVSEQQVLDCSQGGTCGGGWYDKVFEFMVKTGADRAGDYSAYKAADGTCNDKGKAHLRAVNWGYVNAHEDIPSVAELKKALLEHGPLSICVNATPLFQAYSGGVFNEHATGDINHAILLVGWDDSKGSRGAWKIKNSWSTNWGEKGFMWIEYGSNKVGYRATWVNARTIHYALPKRFFDLVKVLRPHPDIEPFKFFK